VVRRIITSDEYSHFELAEHLTGEHHHHLICSNCGAVEDFTVPGELEDLIDRASESIARRKRFAVDHHRLDLVGLCAGCG
jgi:Fe2+ or Zn2+ uptake regulation protein